MDSMKLLALGLLALAVGISAPAAAQKMYTGSWVAESFGNDLVGGTGESAVFSVFAMPQGVLCNPGAPRCSFASTPVSTPGGSFSALGDFCTPYTVWNPSRPAKGATVTSGGQPLPQTPRYRNPAFFTAGGAPKTTSCTATTTIGGSPATTFLTTNDPARGVVMNGAPLTGGGTATTTTGGAAVAFKIPANGMKRTTLGEFNNIPPYIYSYTYATLANDAGTFGPGAGPGSFTINYKVGGGTVAQVKVTSGPNQFGGVMKLLGQMTTKVCYFRQGGCSLGGMDWRYDAVGAKAYTFGGVVTGGYIATYTNMYYHTVLMQTSTVLASGGRFPWTTGTATLTATGRGPHNTVHVRKGFDTRTSGGAGKIQLVSPIITRWLQPALNFETGGIGILKLEFAPEPGAMAMLAGGLSLLVVLFRARGR